MDEFVFVGVITGAHGIHGEIKILTSLFEKDLVYKKGLSLYITPLYIEEVIKNYRTHKNFDLVSFEKYNDINEINKYRNMNVYAKRSDMNLGENEYLIEDLIGYDVYDKQILLGQVKEIKFNNNVLLKVSGKKDFYIPLIDNYISDILTKEKKIITENGSDLII